MTSADPPTVPLPVIVVDPWAAPAPGTPSSVPAPVRPGPGSAGTDPGRWTVVDVLAGLGAVLLLSQVLGWPFSALPHSAREVQIIVAGFLPVWLGLGGAAVLASRARGTGRLRNDLGLRMKPVDLAIGLGLGVGLRICSGVIALVVQGLFGRAGSGNLDVLTGGGLSATVVVVNLVLGGTLIAPFVEELFFRGLLLRSMGATLVRRARRRGLADVPGQAARRRNAVIAASALLFALMHLAEVSDPVGALTLMLTLLLVGAIHAVVTWHTGRLGPAIVSHIVFNGSAALLLLAR